MQRDRRECVRTWKVRYGGGHCRSSAFLEPPAPLCMLRVCTNPSSPPVVRGQIIISPIAHRGIYFCQHEEYIARTPCTCARGTYYALCDRSAAALAAAYSSTRTHNKLTARIFLLYSLATEAAVFVRRVRSIQRPRGIYYVLYSIS